jgi:hypothetical protein
VVNNRDDGGVIQDQTSPKGPRSPYFTRQRSIDALVLVIVTSLVFIVVGIWIAY